MDALKFVVLDEEDLEVASTHLQDAVVKVSDILGDRRKSAWWWRSTALTGRVRRVPNPEYRRRRAALRFERVLSCKCRQMNPARKDAVLNLLAVEFSETEAPSGVVTLTFSGGATMRLDVECLEAELADLGPSWTTAACPCHAELEKPAAKRSRLTASRSGQARKSKFRFKTVRGNARKTIRGLKFGNSGGVVAAFSNRGASCAKSSF